MVVQRGLPAPHTVDRLFPGQGSRGIERLEASSKAQAFSLRRHDTCAIDFALAVIQTFRYRGALRYITPCFLKASTTL